ncbi:MAG: hypothetical protein NC089_12145 [Bacteroides sp.]|nr:hypothetical protein [Bacteroides sp.]MCM1550621.1 hypothetical protein [Clostridium sp.]
MNDPLKEDLCQVLGLDTIVDLAPGAYKFMYQEFITTIKISEGTLMQISVYGSPVTPVPGETATIIEKLSEKFENHYISYTNNALHVSTSADIRPLHIKEILDEIHIYYTLYEFKFSLIPEQTYIPKEHYLLGAIGAIIGVLPGMLLWLLPFGSLTSARLSILLGLLLSFGGFRCYLLFARDLPQYGWSVKNAFKNTSVLFGCGMTLPGLIISGTCILIALLIVIQLDYVLCIMQLRDCSFQSARLFLHAMLRLNGEFQLSYWKHFAYCFLDGIAAGFFTFTATINRMPRRM